MGAKYLIFMVEPPNLNNDYCYKDPKVYDYCILDPWGGGSVQVFKDSNSKDL